MPEEILLDLGEAGAFPLRLTMARLERLEELTGVDLLDGTPGAQERNAALGTPRNLARTLYALAAPSMPYAAFADLITPAIMGEAAGLVGAVMRRDTASPAASGKARADAPTS